MKTRTETAVSFVHPETSSGLRRLSISSIALLQLTGNPYLGVMLDGDPDPHDRLEQLKFFYIHAADPETVRRVCLAARRDPDILTAAALTWGEDFSPDDVLGMVQDMQDDKADLSNAATEIIPQGSPSPSKNWPSHQC